MLVIGARGHALEILQVLPMEWISQELCFFDNVNADAPPSLYNQFPVLRSKTAAQRHLQQDTRFVLGVGGPYVRKRMAELLRQWKGELTSVIATSACIGSYGVYLGSGVNIMHAAFISNEVHIGEGTLLNAHAAVHHNCETGQYCEISPGARLLGHVRLGSCVQIGAGATVLPHVRIGDGAVVGAGAVVTRDVPTAAIVAGVPARLLRHNPQV